MSYDPYELDPLRIFQSTNGIMKKASQPASPSAIVVLPLQVMTICRQMNCCTRRMIRRRLMIITGSIKPTGPTVIKLMAK